MVRVLVSVILIILAITTCAGVSLAEEVKVNECGRLSYFWNECWLFAPFCGGKQYLLHNNGGFENFDTVRVQGVSGPCYVMCANIPLYYCISDPIITDCEPEPLGCGVLREVILPGCNGIWLWESVEWGKLEFSQSQFASGDTVFAVGFVDRTCGQVCMFGEACLVDATLMPCNSPPVSIFPTTWGQIKRR